MEVSMGHVKLRGCAAIDSTQIWNCLYLAQDLFWRQVKV